MNKVHNLFLQSLSDTLAFGLQDQPLRGILAAHKPEQTVLQAVERVLQREVQHRTRLYFPAPHRFTLCDLQAQPQCQPAFARFAGTGKQSQPSGKQAGDNPLYGR